MSDWQGFLSAHEPLMITVAPLAYGFKLGGLQSPSQQQPTPASREGKTVTDQTKFSTAATNPLPQEREQNAAAVSDDLKTESSLYPSESSLHGQSDSSLPPPPWGGLGRGQSGCSQSAIAVITESDLYQYVARSRVHNRRKKHAAVSDGLLRDPAEINIGDPVVHEEHGIGRYRLVTMDLGGETNEMMLLEYAGEAQLYARFATAFNQPLLRPGA